MSTYSPIIHPVDNVQAMAHFNLNKVKKSKNGLHHNLMTLLHEKKKIASLSIMG